MTEKNTSKKPAVFLDDILVKFKLSGRYYVGFILMCCLLFINDSFLCGDYIFVAERSAYRCADERFGNDSCASLSNSTEVCKEWVYEDPHSFVAEFQLACQEWKRTLVGTTQSFGYGIGLLFVGPLSDRWGRKRLILVSAVTSMSIGVIKSFITNYWCYILMEFLHSTFSNVYSPAYILMIEIVANDKRTLTKILCSFGSSFGGALNAFMAWLVPYWRHLLLVFYGPAVIFLTYLYFLDESPRWLLSKGKKEKAVAILQNAAKTCKANLDKNVFENLTYEKNEENISLKQCLRSTFSSGVMIKRFLICLVWWSASTFVSYGISINSVSLPGNKYINYGLMTVVDLPARLTLLWLLNSFKRRTVLISGFFLAAVICFVQPFTPESMPWLSTLLYLCGHFVVGIYFATTYIFTSELFPTYTRNSMHALCSSLGRVGSMIAPQTPLLIDYWHGLPSLTFGAVSLLGGCVTLLAPKTASDVLPDTVKQAEALGHNETTSTNNDNTTCRQIHVMKEL